MTTSATTSPTAPGHPERHDAGTSWLPVAAVGVTLVLWASAFVAIRHLADDFSPGALSLGRLAVGALVLAGFAVPRGMPRLNRRQWVSIVVIGVLWYAAYMVALNAGEHRVDAGTAAMLIQVSPVLVALLASLFLSERFTPYLAAGLALAFAGVAVIALSTSDGAGHDALGVLLVLAAAVVYSVALVVQKPLMATMPALHVTWLACSVGAVVCLPFAGSLVSGVRDAPASSVWWLVYLGVFPTAIAFTTYAYAMRRMTASNLAITTYLVPPITVVLGLVFLGETPPGLAYLGGVLALVGVGVSRRRRRTPPATPARRSRTTARAARRAGRMRR